MEKEQIQDWQNKAFQAKTKDEWKQVLGECKKACEGDEKSYLYLKNYFLKILPKKKEYFEKYPPKDKRIYPTKVTYLLQEDVAKTLNEYLTLLVIEKKLEIQNKFNINLN
jgi:hypothetical protein